MEDMHKCDNCGKLWPESKLEAVEKLSERVGPGSTMPSGQCPDPDCGALCFPVVNQYEDLEGIQYEVIVGNIGTVYSGPDVVMARQHYKEYVEQSTSNYGRAAGEQVTLMQDDEPIEEHYGTQNEESDDR